LAGEIESLSLNRLGGLLSCGRAIKAGLKLRLCFWLAVLIPMSKERWAH